jgi:hypothetical protein
LDSLPDLHKEVSFCNKKVGTLLIKAPTYFCLTQQLPVVAR